MSFRGHLFISEVSLAPSAEWTADAEGWHLLRLERGVGYWMRKGAVQELGAGEVLVAAPGQTGVLRISQLGDAILHHFSFCPEALSGLLTLAERHWLDTYATKDRLETRHFPAAHPVAQEFAALCAGQPSAHRPFQRCRLVHLIASIFGPEAPPPAPVRAKAGSYQRFEEILQRMPDAEIAGRPVAELAKLCGCSARHFGRLFRKGFGVSVRAKQTELRLQKARQLLADTDSKIVHVALESGYNHLGLFNSMFKRRFGMTPSQWRQEQAKTKDFPRKLPRSRSLPLAAVIALAGLLSGARLPAEGATNAPPAAPATAARTNAPTTFEVKGYNVSGNTLLPPDLIGKILSAHTGPALTFTNIRTALADLQMAYRDCGFVTVSVGLPPQTLTNGVVRVQVTEGRLTEITVVGNRFFSSNNVLRALPSVKTNIHLNNLVFQQELERANANRDRQIYPTIAPGAEPGATALTLKVKDRFPLHGRIEFNNYSPPNTPDFRLNTSVQYNNLWQLDHQIGAQYSFSPQQYRDVPVLPDFPDQPAVASYSAFYRLPLKADGNRLKKADYTVSDFGYNEATRRFQAPAYGENAELIAYASRSSQDMGSSLTAESLTPAEIPPNGALQVSDRVYSQTVTVNENFGFRFNAPLPYSGPVRIAVNAGVDYKYYSSMLRQDRTFQAIVFVPPNPPGYGPPFDEFPSPPTSSTRYLPSLVSYLPVSVGLDISQGGPSGTTSLNWNNSVNFPGLFDNSAVFSGIAGSTNATGNYYLTTASLSRDQRIIDWLYLQTRVDGQWANQPLINNEQFGLGGQSGPRGYREGQIYGDAGWRATLEAHTKSLDLGLVDGTVPALMRLGVFTDYGQVFQYTRDRLPDWHANLWGAGGGLSLSVGEHWDLRGTAGWALLPVPGVAAGDFRATFSIALQF